MGEFKYIHLIISLKALNSGRLPRYKNSMIRGVIGHILKSQVCYDLQLECQSCNYINSCIYPLIFEAPHHLTKKINKGGTVPHPYIIRCHNSRTKFNIEDLLEIEILLLGEDSIKFTPYLYNTFERISTYPMGKDKVKFYLNDIKQKVNETYHEVLNSTFVRKPSVTDHSYNKLSYSNIKLSFLTPFRYQKQGKLIREININSFQWNLKNRYDTLNTLYSPTHNDNLSEDLLPNIPESTVSILEQRWVDYERYSNKQRTKMKLGGILATINFQRSPELDLWLPYLFFGEKFHVGKATTFGLGQYELWFK